MAVFVNPNDLLRLFKEMGAPGNCVEFRLIARIDQAVIAEATYYPDLALDEDGNFRKLIKRYRLIEIEGSEEDAQR